MNAPIQKPRLYELMMNWVQDLGPAQVLEQEQVEGARIVWHFQQWLPASILVDEPMLKSHIAITRANEGQKAIADCQLHGKLVPQGFTHHFIKYEDVEDAETMFPSRRAVLFHMLGWAVKDAPEENPS